MGGYPNHVEALEFILTKNQEKQQAKNREKGKANTEVMTKFLSNFKQATK